MKSTIRVIHEGKSIAYYVDGDTASSILFFLEEECGLNPCALDVAEALESFSVTDCAMINNFNEDDIDWEEDDDDEDDEDY